MTMSQLLRRTKKCCIKLLRKLSLSPGSRSSSPATSSSPSNVVLNNSKTKYCQQKNKSPSHRCQIAPSPQHSISLSFGRSADEINCSMAYDESVTNKSIRNFKNQQKSNKRIFLNHRNSRKSNRLQSSSLDDDISFTDNQIYVGPNLINMTGTNKPKTKINKCLFPVDNEAEDDANHLCNNTNTMATHQFIDEHLDFNENQTAGNYLSNDNENCKKHLRDVTLNENRNGKCCRKLQLGLDNDHDGKTNEASSYQTEGILFEKVRYDGSKKYFHNTPSTLSTPSRRSLSNNLDFSTLSYGNKQHFNQNIPNRSLSNYDNLQWPDTSSNIGQQMVEFVDDDEDDCRNPWENDYRYHNLNKFKYEKIKFKNEVENTWEHSLDNSAISSDSSNHTTASNQWGGFFNAAAAVGVCTKTNKMQYKLMNDFNIENFHVNESVAKTTDIWENFQNKAYEIDFDNWQSSRRSSIDTVETWIDVDFDNSFNEELEQRCAVVTTISHKQV